VSAWLSRASPDFGSPRWINISPICTLNAILCRL